LTNFQQRIVHEPGGGVALDCVLDGFSGPVQPDVGGVRRDTSSDRSRRALRLQSGPSRLSTR
jgi:hypothetical protein